MLSNKCSGIKSICNVVEWTCKVENGQYSTWHWTLALLRGQIVRWLNLLNLNSILKFPTWNL